MRTHAYLFIFVWKLKIFSISFFSFFFLWLLCRSVNNSRSLGYFFVLCVYVSMSTSAKCYGIFIFRIIQNYIETYERKRKRDRSDRVRRGMSVRLETHACRNIIHFAFQIGFLPTHNKNRNEKNLFIVKSGKWLTEHFLFFLLNPPVWHQFYCLCSILYFRFNSLLGTLSLSLPFLIYTLTLHLCVNISLYPVNNVRA